MSAAVDFLTRRKPFTNEYFAAPGSRKTVLLCSHAHWTEEMAHALLVLGFNVLVAEPWSALWSDDAKFASFDKVFQQWVRTIKKFKVQLVIGGNASAMAPHFKTKEPLHVAARVPVVHYWVDDPRTPPALMRRGLSAHDYLRCIRDGRTLNVIWEPDILEEMRRFLGVENSIHLPPAVTPDVWQTKGAPLAARAPTVCLAGQPVSTEDSSPARSAELITWAGRVVDVKLANPERPLADCLETTGGPGEKRGSTTRRPYELAANLKDEFERWAVLNEMLADRVRTPILQQAEALLGPNLRTAKKADHPTAAATGNLADVAARKASFVAARASLSFFGRREADGEPFRPFEIAAASGLLLAEWSPRLSTLFEPQKECLAFRNAAELREQVERLLRDPAEYDAVVEAGRRRLTSEHTWEHRLAHVLTAATERFGLSW